ncbi:MAG: hypothetical protein JO218_16045 [Burkholderiales bacterium]|nr:hypothetical protein [Roseateles sp.]MBV8467452.1 hypothetical protein [Burkholderiales bacterium]
MSLTFNGGELGQETFSTVKPAYALNQSLDGYVDHMKLGPPAPAAFRHFIELVRGLTGSTNKRVAKKIFMDS